MDLSKVIVSDVDWKPVGGRFDDVPWIEADLAITAMGISQYKLFDAGPNTNHIWRYQLYFINTEGSGFYFTDESDDEYSCSTMIDGEHNIQYNSDKPTIVSVRAKQ